MLAKEDIRNYLEDKKSVTLSQIFRELEINLEELDSIEGYLRELVQEGWLKKEFCREHNVFEYKPGDTRMNPVGEL